MLFLYNWVPCIHKHEYVWQLPVVWHYNTILFHYLMSFISAAVFFARAGYFLMNHSNSKGKISTVCKSSFPRRVVFCFIRSRLAFAVIIIVNEMSVFRFWGLVRIECNTYMCISIRRRHLKQKDFYKYAHCAYLQTYMNMYIHIWVWVVWPGALKDLF